MGRTGLEHIAKTQEKTGFYKSGGADSGAVDSKTIIIDPSLMRIVDAWPSLPEEIQASILTMVRCLDS